MEDGDGQATLVPFELSPRATWRESWTTDGRTEGRTEAGKEGSSVIPRGHGALHCSRLLEESTSSNGLTPATTLSLSTESTPSGP